MWDKLGVGGNSEDVDEVVNALNGTGISCRCTNLFSLNVLTFNVYLIPFEMLVTWPHKQIQNLDVIRMHSVCELMHLCPRQSIYFVAINAMGEKTVRVNS